MLDSLQGLARPESKVPGGQRPWSNNHRRGGPNLLAGSIWRKIRNSQCFARALSCPHAPSMVAPLCRRKWATMPRVCGSSRNTPTVSRGGGS